MIVSNNLNRSTSRWMQACVLLCALVVLPLSFACQNNDAGIVNKEPNLNMAADPAKVEEYEEYLEGMRIRLRKAVEAGTMTREEARLKMAEFERGDKEKMRAGKKDKDKDYYETIGRKIKAAVAGGELTEEEAKAKWAYIDKKAGAKTKTKKAADIKK